ncbi:hypothetical protein H2200_004446 [Cladophialophora chaetospira]|uniref:Transcription factor domain-containing protein n=1 Tax=Cladophialophora chaetospira TaxID=386627 RepID=A0AA38XD50_9EURO|nr:hypothetical protein H2200_004446 [Cladophialophora chaetospira]
MAAVRARRSDNAPIAENDFLNYISSLHMSERIYACLANRTLLHSLTAIPLAQDPEAVRYIIPEMLRIPDQVREGKATPFIHPHSRDLAHGWLDSATKPGENDCLSPGLRDFVNINAESLPPAELVSATQALILFLIQHAFSTDRPESNLIDIAFKILAKWRNMLWTTGFQGMSDDLSPWQTWILAESLRRTILMAYLLEGTYCAWTLGWCTHQLFVYALPFSTQGGLWLADSEEEWFAQANDRSMGSPAAAARELTSLKELTLNFARSPFQPGDDLFQKLLLVSHHGRKSVESRLARIGQEGAKPWVTMMSFSL